MNLGFAKEQLYEEAETKPKQKRQGDVLTTEVEKRDERFNKRMPDEDGRTILARGEATGHHHSFPSGRAHLFRFDDTALTSYVQIDGVPSALTHQEHGPIPHREGTVKVTQQRQWTLERVKPVID